MSQYHVACDNVALFAVHASCTVYASMSSSSCENALPPGYANKGAVESAGQENDGPIAEPNERIGREAVVSRTARFASSPAVDVVGRPAVLHFQRPPPNKRADR